MRSEKVKILGNPQRQSMHWVVCVDRKTMKYISSHQRLTMRNIAPVSWSLLQDESPFEN